MPIMAQWQLESLFTRIGRVVVAAFLYRLVRYRVLIHLGDPVLLAFGTRHAREQAMPGLPLVSAV